MSDTEIIVTVEHGRGTRRYVVVDNRELFEGVPDGFVPDPGTQSTNKGNVRDVRMAREDHLGRFGFGAHWLRSLGNVDEMYRSLSTWEVVKVQRIASDRVWG